MLRPEMNQDRPYQHDLLASANTVLLESPPMSRLAGTVCSKFNLDIDIPLSSGMPDYARTFPADTLIK
jgi:hypothetical protein